MKFGVFIYDGTEPIDLATFGVLSMARRLRPEIEICTIAPTRDVVHLSNGLRVVPDHALDVESLSIRDQLGDKSGIAESLEGLARDLCALGSPERAVQTWGAAESLRDEIGVPMSPTARADHVEQVAAARAAIADAAEFDRAWQEGRSTSLEQAITDALQPLGL